MTLKTIVKVGGITNLSDARYCAGMGVDMLGFCFSQNSIAYIELENFKEIASWVSGVEIIAEFEDESKDQIEAILSTYSFSGILTKSLEAGKYFQSKGIKVILSLDLDSKDQFDQFRSNLSNYVSFDLIQISSDEPEIISSLNGHLSDWAKKISILKSFDNTPGKILDHITEESFKGVALNGSHEVKPGFKDYDEIADILEVLEEED
jgi:phosphoribosylanthranilate isomerase